MSISKCHTTEKPQVMQYLIPKDKENETTISKMNQILKKICLKQETQVKDCIT